MPSNSQKKDKLEVLQEIFKKKKILKIEDLFKAIGTNSRMTVHRYMKNLDYLIRYTHKGQYYILSKVARFDSLGLWHCGDIGFSKHGTLFETVTHLVNNSEMGMTSSELHIESKTVVKHTLLDLVEKNKLSRAKSMNVYVYLSSDLTKAKQQLKIRQDVVDVAIDDAVALRVLLMAYRLIGSSISPEFVSDALRKEGSEISLTVVSYIFQQYELEKKRRTQPPPNYKKSKK